MTEADKPSFEWVLDDTKDGVTITLAKMPFHLTTRDLEIVLAELGSIRGQLQPPVPSNIGLSPEIHTAANLQPAPTPAGQTDEPDPAWTLLFRSTHFGWFRLMLSRAASKDLGALLQSDPAIVPNPTAH